MLSGIGTGKSHFYQAAAYMQMWNSIMKKSSPCTVIGESQVDGKPWYTVSCDKEVAAWIRQQPGEDKIWMRHIDNNWNIYSTQFDMDEELYLMLRLTWGE